MNHHPHRRCPHHLPRPLRNPHPLHQVQAGHPLQAFRVHNNELRCHNFR